MAKKIFILLLALCLLSCGNAFAVSQDSSRVLPNDREDTAYLLEQLEVFQQKLLQNIKDKTTEEIKEIYNTFMVELVASIGQYYTFPQEVKVAHQQFLIDNDLLWLWSISYMNNTRSCMPDESVIDEHIAIEIAENEIISNGHATREELDSYYLFTGLHYSTNLPDQYWWDVYYITETPDASFPYFIRFIVEIDAQSGEIQYIVPINGSG